MILVIVASTFFLVTYLLVKRSLARRRRAYDASRRPEELERRLNELFDVAIETLGRGLLDYPEVEQASLGGGEAIERLRTAVSLCSTRYGIDSRCILASFAKVPKGRAADVTWEHELRAIRRHDGQLNLEQSADPVRWRVRVSYHAQEDHDVLLASVAHELAHIALKSRGAWYEDQQLNELLAEAAAVLAGFGRIMRATAYVEIVRSRLLWLNVGVTGLGYLHERSIDQLRQRRTELARRGERHQRR